MNLSIAIMKRVPDRTQSTEQHTPCIPGARKNDRKQFCRKKMQPRRPNLITNFTSLLNFNNLLKTLGPTSYKTELQAFFEQRDNAAIS